MSYTFFPNQYYRMPTHFGPSLGPRQGIDNRRYANLETSTDVIVQATFAADAAQLDKLLPPGFILREPSTLTVCFDYVRNIEWLAGRGYNTFGVSIPATYQGQDKTVHGDLLLVLWENMADPIITGREDLGFSKVYCELPEPQFIGEDVICRASWDGCEFAHFKLSNLKELALDNLPEATSVSEGTLHYKYMPKTGAPGEADTEYAVLTPGDWPNVKLDQVKSTDQAVMQFRQSTWEELPTLVHIVNTLAGLTLGECLEASVVKSHGGKDLSDQRILR